MTGEEKEGANVRVMMNLTIHHANHSSKSLLEANHQKCLTKVLTHTNLECSQLGDQCTNTVMLNEYNDECMAIMSTNISSFLNFTEILIPQRQAQKIKARGGSSRG